MKRCEIKKLTTFIFFNLRGPTPRKTLSDEVSLGLSISSQTKSGVVTNTGPSKFQFKHCLILEQSNQVLPDR